MFGMYLVPIAICKYKRHSKLQLTPIKNLLIFGSEYLVKFCNYYPRLSLEIVSPALKLTQICCMNIYEHLRRLANLITNLLLHSYTHTKFERMSLQSDKI